MDRDRERRRKIAYMCREKRWRKKKRDNNETTEDTN